MDRLLECESNVGGGWIAGHLLIGPASSRLDSERVRKLQRMAECAWTAVRRALQQMSEPSSSEEVLAESCCMLRDPHQYLPAAVISVCWMLHMSVEEANHRLNAMLQRRQRICNFFRPPLPPLDNVAILRGFHHFPFEGVLRDAEFHRVTSMPSATAFLPSDEARLSICKCRRSLTTKLGLLMYETLRSCSVSCPFGARQR